MVEVAVPSNQLYEHICADLNSVALAKPATRRNAQALHCPL
jgi:hypothetical protein